MSSTMIDEKRLEELTAELAKGVKIEKDLVVTLGQLMKMIIQKNTLICLPPPCA